MERFNKVTGAGEITAIYSMKSGEGRNGAWRLVSGTINMGIFLKFTAWNGTADKVSKFHIGDMMEITDGELKVNSYEKDGAKVWEKNLTIKEIDESSIPPEDKIPF